MHRSSDAPLIDLSTSREVIYPVDTAATFGLTSTVLAPMDRLIIPIRSIATTTLSKDDPPEERVSIVAAMTPASNLLHAALSTGIKVTTGVIHIGHARILTQGTSL